MTEVDVLIVGAGMTGLMAAHQLQSAANILLLDSRDQVGGRMYTMRLGAGLADIGAQFFTVHTPEFEYWSEKWLADGLIEQWATGWSDASLTDVTYNVYRRFIVRQGMSTLARHLAQPLVVETSSCAEHVGRMDDMWQVRTVDGRRYACRAILLTPPVPLILQLLDSSQVELSPSDLAALQGVDYDPCLVAVFQLDGGTKLPGLGAVQLPQAPIRYLVDNQRKGISPNATLVTAQADTGYSRRKWDEADEDILQDIMADLKPFLLPRTRIVAHQLHRWPFALPTKLYPQRYLVAADLPPLVFAGDAFGSIRGIEGSALSGLAAGQALAQLLLEK